MEAMSALIAAIVAIAVLVGFDVAAIGWGTDSRPTLVDDHRR
jgi:hypothetical protein